MTATIILDGVNIKGSNPFNAQSAKDIALILIGDNTITSTGGGPAVSCPVGVDTKLTICNGEIESGSEGKLKAIIPTNNTNIRFPGIGFYSSNAKGTLIINGGNIIAQGGYNAAGIGQKQEQSGGTVIINGGIISATGGNNATGIGGGFKGGNVTVEINGGTVSATGVLRAAAIGSAHQATEKSIVTITGGDITAKGGSLAPCIGGGIDGKGESVTISGGVVKTISSNNTNGSGIGNPATVAETNSTFSTGTSGKAVIITKNIADLSGISSWSGMIFKEGVGLIYGGDSYTLEHNIEIPENNTLKIESGKTLTINDGVTLTNKGIIQKQGTITGQERIEGLVQLPFTDNMVILSNDHFTYDGTEKRLSSVIIKDNSRIYQENVDYTIKYDNNKQAAESTSTEAPYIEIIPKGEDKNSHLFGESYIQKFTIHKAVANVNLFRAVIPDIMVYDGTNHGVKVFFQEESESNQILYASALEEIDENDWSEEVPINAGEYRFAVKLVGDPNFKDADNLTADDWRFTIAKADPTFAAWRVSGKAFDMSPITSITAPTLNGIKQDGQIETEGKLSYTYYYVQDEEEVETTAENAGAEATGGAPVLVGKYKVKAKFLGNDNYNERESTSPLFSITKVYPSFSSIEVPQYAVYDGTTTFTAKANVKGVAADETQYVAAMAYEKKNAAGEFEPLTEGALPKEAGEYRAIASFTDRNYMDINTKMPFSIQPKPLSATTATLSEETFTYNGTDQRPTVTEVKEGETTLVAGADYTVKGPEASTNAGSYEMTITGKGNYQGTCTKAYTIEKATPTYTVPTGLTAIFGKTLADVTFPSAENGAWSWQAEETTLVGSVGENIFLATFTPTDVNNYNVVKDVEVTITVTEKGLDEATIQFERASITLMKGSTVPANALTKPADCTVTYSSDNEKVATVDAATGVVTVVGVGTTTITATAFGDYSGSASYSLTVTQYVPNAYTVTIPDHVTGAIIVGGGTRKVEENGEVTFRIELDPNGNGQYPTVTTSNGMTLTHDGNGNYRFQAMGDTQVMIGEVPGYSYYLMTLPQETVEESDSTFWSAEGIEVVGAAAVPAMRAVSDSETGRFMAPFGTMVTLRPIETAERKFLQWENGSTERERTLTLRADEEIRALWQKVSAVGIEEIAANSLIRGERGQLCIEVPVSCDAVIYSYNGVPVRMAHLTEGSNRIHSLPAGLYLVQIGHARAVAVRVR